MFAMSHPLQRALQRFRTPPSDGATGRLRHVERDMGDIKNRVNGLIFLVAGTVITQLLMRVLAW